MNQAQMISDIAMVDNLILFNKQKKVAIDVAIEELNGKRDVLYKQCNHTHPNGDNSWRDGFIMSTCTICGEDDMFSEVVDICKTS